MAGSDVVVTSGDDLALEGGFSWNVYSSVVVEETIPLGDTSVVSEGGCNSCVPQLFLLGGFLDLSMCRVGGWHDERSEVFCLEDNNVIVILFALVMVVTSRQEVGLLVKDARFVS